jgi:hypothetical protein
MGGQQLSDETEKDMHAEQLLPGCPYSDPYAYGNHAS